MKYLMMELKVVESNLVLGMVMVQVMTSLRKLEVSNLEMKLEML